MRSDTAPAGRIVTRRASYAVAVDVPSSPRYGVQRVRDPRRGELDEEHRLRRARRLFSSMPDLLERAVALAQVARGAGGDDVLPDRLAALRARHDVVERQPAARRAAVDAAPAVAGEERPAGDLPLDRPRHPDVVDEPDHVRPDEAAGGRAQRLVELLDRPRPCPCRGARGRAEPCTRSAARSWRSRPEPAAPGPKVPAGPTSVTAFYEALPARRPRAPRARGRPRRGRGRAP